MFIYAAGGVAGVVPGAAAGAAPASGVAIPGGASVSVIAVESASIPA